MSETAELSKKDRLILRKVEEVTRVNDQMVKQKHVMERAKEALTEERKAYEKLVAQISELVSEITDIESGQLELPYDDDRPKDSSAAGSKPNGKAKAGKPAEPGEESQAAAVPDVEDIPQDPEVVLPEKLDDLPKWVLPTKVAKLLKDHGEIKTPAELYAWLTAPPKTFYPIKGVGGKTRADMLEAFESLLSGGEDPNDDVPF